MEAILKEAGSCGGYQAFHLIFAQMPRFLAAWSITFMMFGGFNPGWRCDVGHASINSRNHSNTNTRINASAFDSHGMVLGLLENNTSSTNGNYGVYTLVTPTEGEGRQYARDSREDTESYNGTCDEYDSCTDGIEFNPTSRTIVTEFQLVCDRFWLLRAILLIQSVGVFLMPLLAGQIGDKFGRKFSLYGCTAIICVFSGVAIASHHWVMFAICYFFIGGASNSIIGIAPVFTLEVLNSKWRGYYNSLPTANLAMSLFTVVSYFLRNWMSLHIITCVTGFVSCVGFLIVPESPRWLMANGRASEAEKSIQTIAKFNRRGKIDRGSFRKFRESIEKQKSSVERTYTLLDLIKNRELAIMTVKFCLMFMIQSASYMSVSYGLSSLPGSYYTNAILALGLEVIFVMSSGPLCNLIGRRFTGTACGAIGTIACVAIVISLTTTQESQSRIWIVSIFAYFAKSSSQAMLCVGTTFCSELYPTVVRSIAIGLMRCFVGVGALIMPFIIPSKYDSSLTIYFSIMSVCYFVTCIIFTSLPETNRCNMADVLVRKAGDEELEVVLVAGNDGAEGIGDADYNGGDDVEDGDRNVKKSSHDGSGDHGCDSSIPGSINADDKAEDNADGDNENSLKEDLIVQE